MCYQRHVIIQASLRMETGCAEAENRKCCLDFVIIITLLVFFFLILIH